MSQTDVHAFVCQFSVLRMARPVQLYLLALVSDVCQLEGSLEIPIRAGRARQINAYPRGLRLWVLIGLTLTLCWVVNEGTNQIRLTAN